MSPTIKMDDVYRVYASDQDPKTLFSKAKQWLSTIPVAPLDTHKPIVEKQLKDSITRCVFGSNQIEGAGLGLDDTIKICHRILDGEDMDIIDERTPEYERILGEMYANQPNSDYKTRPLKAFVRGRGEVINHVKAFQFMLDWAVTLDESFTEQTIKDTHRILCSDTPIEHRENGKLTGVSQAKDYAGKYREVFVGGGTTLFTPPQYVPKQMRELVDQLNADIQAAREEKKEMDPFALAAQYSMEFVQIHPFQDGNGRMCRMLLNAILYKFAGGIVVPIGESKEDREEYMGIKKRASAEAADHGEYAVFVLKKCETRLRVLKKKLAGKK